MTGVLDRHDCRRSRHRRQSIETRRQPLVYITDAGAERGRLCGAEHPPILLEGRAAPGGVHDDVLLTWHRSDDAFGEAAGASAEASVQMQRTAARATVTGE